MIPHLLVFNDQRAMTFIVSYMLKGTCWRVSASECFAHTLVLIHQENVDVILVDHETTRIEGLELIEGLRLSHPNLAVVLMSSFPQEIDMEQARRLGILAILEKPFAQGLLILTLNEALRKMASP